MKYLLKIALVIIVLALHGYAQSGKWEISGYMPKGIYGAETVVVDSIVYVFGGYSDSIQKATDWIYAFNPSDNSWKFIGKMKKKRRNFYSGIYNNKIIYAGGETEAYFKANGLVEVFDPSNKSVTAVDSNRIFNRVGAAGLVDDSVFYIAGGQPYNPPPQNMNPYFFEYNIRPKSILLCRDNYFHERYPEEQMMSSAGDYIYIMGGNVNTITKDIYRYNKLKHWLVKLPAGLLSNRSGGRAVRLKDTNKIMLIGGYNETSNALSTVELYDFQDTLRTVSQTLPDINIKRNHFMTAYINGYMYVFGGEGDNGMPVREIERYQVVTDIKNEEPSSQPYEYRLSQNYPNPFNGTTVINYSVPERENISIKIYDMLGKEVAEVINGEQQPGNHSVTFNSSGLTSGIYFYRMTSGNSSTTRKMILLK